jgi:PTS system mannose-specific IIA component
MVGLVVAAHGHLADELVHTAEQIVGPLPSVRTCSIEAGASPESIRAAMHEAMQQLDGSGEGVVVLADLFGGTPCTQSLSLCGRHKLEVVTGVNLPMLLKANSLRREPMPLQDLAIALTQYGQRNITCASAMLRDVEDKHAH